MPAEHVVSTRLDTCQGHPKSTPDRQRPLYLSKGVTVRLQNKGAQPSAVLRDSAAAPKSARILTYASHLTGTLEVLPRHGERSDKHGATAQQKHSSHQRTQASEENGSEEKNNIKSLPNFPPKKPTQPAQCIATCDGNSAHYLFLWSSRMSRNM